MRRGQCTPRCAGFGIFRHLVAWTFAIAVLILWIASAVADLQESKPPSLYPLYDLLSKYFPVERCDVER
jgi:hypothetical protein